MPNPIGKALRNRRAGHGTLVWARSDLQAPETIALTSPAFEHEAPMPERYRGHLFGANISPALTWTAPPAGTVELVLIAEDPDVPMGKPATHVVAVGIDPSSTGVDDGALAHPSTVAGVRLGKGAGGRRGWSGPMPIPSHGPHSYVFQLFAVDKRLDLPERLGLAAVVAAMTGHVLARGRLDGTFENP